MQQSKEEWSIREKCILKDFACSTGLGMVVGIATSGITGLATAAAAVEASFAA